MELLCKLSRHCGLLSFVATLALATVAWMIEPLGVVAGLIHKAPMTLGCILGRFIEESESPDTLRYSSVNSTRICIIITR